MIVTKYSEFLTRVPVILRIDSTFTIAFFPLTVKIYPPGRVSMVSIPGCHSREDTKGNSTVSMQPVSFLLVFRKPEEVTLRLWQA